MGQAAQQAAYQLATVSTAVKNQALAVIADELEANLKASWPRIRRIWMLRVRPVCLRRCWTA